MTDRLLGELAELKDSAVYEELQQRRAGIIASWTASLDDRLDLLLKGEKRMLDQLLDEIDRAHTQLLKRRQQAERPNMSKTF